jgi:hypothetical protein
VRRRDQAELAGQMRPAAAEVGAVLQRAAGAGRPRVAAPQRRWRCSTRRGETAMRDQTAGAGTHTCREGRERGELTSVTASRRLLGGRRCELGAAGHQVTGDGTAADAARRERLWQRRCGRV